MFLSSHYIFFSLFIFSFSLFSFFTFFLPFISFKNALVFIPYFLVGVIAATVLENIHVAFTLWGMGNREGRGSRDSRMGWDGHDPTSHPTVTVLLLSDRLDLNFSTSNTSNSSDSNDKNEYGNGNGNGNRSNNGDISSSSDIPKDSPLSIFITCLYRVHNYNETFWTWPWVHNNHLLSYFYTSTSITASLSFFSSSSPSSLSPPPPSSSSSTFLSSSNKTSSTIKNTSMLRIPHLNHKDHNYNKITNNENNDSNHPTKHTGFIEDKKSNTQESSFFLITYYLWRFFPDITSVGIGFLMSTLGGLDNDNIKYVIQFIILPSSFLILIVSSMLQKGSARHNLSRLVLESAPLTSLGYASYAIYLFQRIVFNFYLPYIYFGFKNNHFDTHTGDPDFWYEYLPTFYKFLSVVFLTLVCGFVHKYFQDRFVIFLYTKVLSLFN